MKSCDYGIANRERIKALEDAVIDLRNHFSNRLPAWATALLTLLSSISTGLIVWSFK